MIFWVQTLPNIHRVYIYSLLSLLWTIILLRECMLNRGHIWIIVLLCNCNCFSSDSLPVFIKMHFKLHFLRDSWICHAWLSTFLPICYSSYYSCSKIPQAGWLEKYRTENIWLCDQVFKPYLIPKCRDMILFPVVRFSLPASFTSLLPQLGSELFKVVWHKVK